MITISSGHGLHVRGARGLIDEVDEARRVVNRTAELLKAAGSLVNVFHDDVSRTQRDNINAIVSYHNSTKRELDISIHFNSTASGLIEDRAIGTEVLYRKYNKEARKIAGATATAISSTSGLLLRHQWRKMSGTVPTANLGFINGSNRTAILIEVCFVNSREDVRLYQLHFDQICNAIAQTALAHTSGNITSADPVSGQEPSPWARTAWAWGIENQITDGTNPQTMPTREQLVQLLFNYHRSFLPKQG